VADSRDVTSVRRLIYVFLGVLVSALVGACGLPGRRAQPAAVLAQYAAALQKGDATRAYALVDAEDRATLDPTAYAARLARDAREARELGDRIARAPAPRVFARVTLEDGTELTLERGPDGFRVSDAVSRYYAQETPRAALLSFIRAVEHERWDVVLALMPAAEREGLDAALLGKQLLERREELTRTVARLAVSRNEPIEVVGDRATMPYRESFTARFVREEGLWKLEDPD
jgi:hypothetical protein